MFIRLEQKCFKLYFFLGSEGWDQYLRESSKMVTL